MNNDYKRYISAACFAVAGLSLVLFYLSVDAKISWILWLEPIFYIVFAIGIIIANKWVITCGAAFGALWFAYRAFMYGKGYIENDFSTFCTVLVFLVYLFAALYWLFFVFGSQKETMGRSFSFAAALVGFLRLPLSKLPWLLTNTDIFPLTGKVFDFISNDGKKKVGWAEVVHDKYSAVCWACLVIGAVMLGCSYSSQKQKTMKQITSQTQSNSVEEYIEKLERLKNLLDSGTITQEEFDNKKKSIMTSLDKS